MNYEKINIVMMKILENKFGIKIIPRVVKKGTKTNENNQETI